MAKRVYAALALVWFGYPETASAWGPIFETLHKGWNIGTALRTLENSNNNGGSHEEEERSSSRKSNNKKQLLGHAHQPTFTFHFETFDPNMMLGMDPILQPILHSKQPLAWNPIESLYISATQDQCMGDDDDDCDEECKIPEEYKTAEGASFDVMAYLGISRAEPLRVKEGDDSVWE